MTPAHVRTARVGRVRRRAREAAPASTEMDFRAAQQPMLSPPPARYRARTLPPWIDLQDRLPGAVYSVSQATVESRSLNFWWCAPLHHPAIREDRRSGRRGV